MIKQLPIDSLYDVLDSPLGELMLISAKNSLYNVLWENDHTASLLKSTLTRAPLAPILVKTKQQLQEYFQGQRREFSIPLTLIGTAFQKQAWLQLQKIPYGKTIHYAEQATCLGDQNKARAVGMANGRNPISIIVPCHRVIGRNGNLTGFAGGLDKKAWLLEHEKNH